MESINKSTNEKEVYQEPQNSSQETEEIKMPDNAYSELKPGEKYRPILRGDKKYPEINGWTNLWGLVMAGLFSGGTAHS